MKLAFALAWRNLWRNPRRTVLSAGAVAFMVLLLVFALSMQLRSYDAMVDHAASVMHGHAQVQRADYVDEPRVRYVLEDAESIAAELRASDKVRAASPRAMSSALASRGETTFGAMVLGVDPAYEAEISWLPGALSAGRYLSSLAQGAVGEDPATPEAVVGTLLARNLGIGLGDEIVLLGVTPRDGMAVLVAQVVGLISSGQDALDRALVQVPLQAFQEAFEMVGAAHSVAIMYESYLDAGPAQGALTDIADRFSGSSTGPGGEVNVALWNRLLPEIEGAIASDMASAAVIYGLLVVLVTFSIANTFMMMLHERTREFGTLLAMGIRPGQLRGTIALETLLLAGLGVLVGALLGAAITAYVGRIGIGLGDGAENMLAQFQMPERIYFGVHGQALLFSCAIMLLTTQIAAFVATRRIHRMEIVEAIREEM